MAIADRFKCIIVSHLIATLSANPICIRVLYMAV